jgi:hypothetical protein
MQDLVVVASQRLVSAVKFFFWADECQLVFVLMVTRVCVVFCFFVAVCFI